MNSQAEWSVEEKSTGIENTDESVNVAAYIINSSKVQLSIPISRKSSRDFHGDPSYSISLRQPLELEYKSDDDLRA